MQISLPPTVSLYSSALRGLWLNYDHFSDYCPSFNIKKSRPDYISNIRYSVFELSLFFCMFSFGRYINTNKKRVEKTKRDFAKYVG